MLKNRKLLPAVYLSDQLTFTVKPLTFEVIRMPVACQSIQRIVLIANEWFLLSEHWETPAGQRSHDYRLLCHGRQLAELLGSTHSSKNPSRLAKSQFARQFRAPPPRKIPMQMTTALLIVNPCDDEEDNMAML